MRTRWGLVLAAGVAVAGAGAVGGVAPARVVAATSSWTNGATTGPAAESGAAMAWDSVRGVDVLLTTGGQTWTWNGSSWTQLSPAHSPGARSNAAMAFDAGHAQAVLFGGKAGSTILQDTWTWNGTDWSLRTPSNTPPARGGASMAYDGKAQRVLLFGGFDGLAVFYDDTWEWNGTNGNWDEQIVNVNGAGAAAPAPRTLAQMSDNGANGTVVLFGGTSPQGPLGDTWVWADTDVTFGNTTVTTEGHWTPVSPTQAPPARSGGTLAFAAGTGDARFGGPILFGGLGATGRLQDAWSFDGSGWAQVTATGPPAARGGAAAAAGPGGTMVVFGGTGGSGALGDTWTWSGTIDAAPLPAPTITTCPAATTALPTATGTGTLRGAAAQSHPGFLIGSALTADELYDADAEQQITAGSQFNTIASSNQMWWSAIENQPYTFTFCDADQFVGYAKAYRQSLLLHTLLGATPGNGQIPTWISSPVLPWTGTSLSAVMKQYIGTYIEHVRGKVSAISVVGEATDPNGLPSKNVFEEAIGYPRYVEEAFQDTDAANPQATIFYDDYHDWFGPKLTATENLVTDLHNTGSRIDGVGMEFFAAGAEVESQNVPGAMATLAAAPYNVKTAITQMTVPWYTTPEPGPNSGFWAAQAGVYRYVLDACLTPASNCFMLMTWAVSDTYSEAASSVSPTTAVGGSLFDETYQPRPAFNAVLTALQ
jgi:GH35 family endo-1,4-beta-xylanase